MPKKNKKDNTIMLVKKDDKKTKLKEDPLFFVFSSTKSEMYFSVSNNSCC